jgi:hypothetical protein
LPHRKRNRNVSSLHRKRNRNVSSLHRKRNRSASSPPRRHNRNARSPHRSGWQRLRRSELLLRPRAETSSVAGRH